MFWGFVFPKLLCHAKQNDILDIDLSPMVDLITQEVIETKMPHKTCYYSIFVLQFKIYMLSCIVQIGVV